MWFYKPTFFSKQETYVKNGSYVMKKWGAKLIQKTHDRVRWWGLLPSSVLQWKENLTTPVTISLSIRNLFLELVLSPAVRLSTKTNANILMSSLQVPAAAYHRSCYNGQKIIFCQSPKSVTPSHLNWAVTAFFSTTNKFLFPACDWQLMMSLLEADVTDLMKITSCLWVQNYNMRDFDRMK
jgi:hypothetical protein